MDPPKTVDKLKDPNSEVMPSPTPEKPKGTQKLFTMNYDENKEKSTRRDKPVTPPPPKQKKICWLTRAMAEDFTRQDVLYTTFRETILYIVFIFAVTMSVIGRRGPMMFYQTDALRDQFIEKEFKSLNNVAISFYEIKSAADFWFYLEKLLMDKLYWEKYYSNVDVTAVKPTIKDDQKILFENQLLGVPRIRQAKVRNDSCVIHTYFKRLFLTCYDLYREADEDILPFGKGTGTAWVYSKSEKTGSIPHVGYISAYEGGGFYQDLSHKKNETKAIFADLKDNLWITRGTRVIFIDFSVYNANSGLFTICKLIFEFPPTGGILPSHQFNTVKLLLKSSKWDRITLGFECAVYGIATYFLIEEIREIIYFKFRYFRQFWTYIDLTIVALTLSTLITSAIVMAYADFTVEKILKNPDEYGNLEYLGAVKTMNNSFAATLLFFAYVKIFKYLSFNKSMGQLNNTLKNCALDILGFSIMFFIIFFAFAELGYLLFGSQVEDFSSFGVSMFTLLRTILGDFDYQAIERANRVLAPIYFLSYIFFVFFVLLNMFLAIINDTYADVKTEIAIAPEEMQMTEFLKNGFNSILQKCGCKIKLQKAKADEFNTTIQQIRDALLKCGFSDEEVETFFAIYNIDIHDESGDHDVKKILKEMEQQAIGKEMEDDSSLVHVSDFITQQDRFDRIEQNIRNLATNIDSLVKKLEAIESARKTTAPHG